MSESREANPRESEDQQLNLIRKDYLLAKPPSTLSKAFHQISNAKAVYEATIGNAQQEQPPIQYRVAFIKYIIKQLESGESDKEEESETASSLWYEALESLGGGAQQTEPFFRLYQLPNNHGMLKIFENETAFVAEGTTGLVTWTASVELANWLTVNASNEEITSRKWILECGCGVGLLATAVLKTFSHLSKYIASDGHFIPLLNKCNFNLEANLGRDKIDVVQVEEIDWVKDGEKFKKVVSKLSEEIGPGILLGADIVFDPSLVAPLVDLIDSFLKLHKQSIAFIACTLRNEDTLELFKNRLENCGLTFQIIHRWENTSSGMIYKLTTKTL